MTLALECSRCATSAPLPPVPDHPGYVDITGVDGWTCPPLLCPSCSAGRSVHIDPIANLLRAGQIAGLDPREMMREALDELRREQP